MAGILVAPGELAAVHDDAADRRAVPTQELGGRVDHDVGAVLDGPAQVRRGHGVVDDQRHAGLMRDGRHLFDVEHVHTRVGDGLAVKGAGLGSDGLAEVFRIVRLYELHVDAQAAEADIELRVGAAVQGAGGDDLVARSRQAGDGQELRGLSAGGGQSGNAAFERRHPLFEHVGGGVHDAAVDVAELLQARTGRRHARSSRRRTRWSDRWAPRGPGKPYRECGRRAGSVSRSPVDGEERWFQP